MSLRSGITMNFMPGVQSHSCLLYTSLTDMGMTISKNTLRNWLKKGKTYLDELVCVLKSIALEKDSSVNCDETWCKVRKYDHYKKCYIWVLVNKARKTAIFFYGKKPCKKLRIFANRCCGMPMH